MRNLPIAVAMLLPTAVLSAQQPVVPAQRPDADVTLDEDARKVFARLLAEYESGEGDGLTQVERLNEWSQRIVQCGLFRARRAGVGRAESAAEEIEEHAQRMAKVEGIARSRVKAGQATAVEETAARYFRREANQVIASLQTAVERDIRVELPKIEKTESARDRQIVINITQEGKIIVAGNPLTLGQLKKVLSEAGVKNPGSVAALIRADRRTLFSNVLAVVKLCEEVGLEFTLTTEAD